MSAPQKASVHPPSRPASDAVDLVEKAVVMNNLGVQLLLAGKYGCASEAFGFALQCIDGTFHVPQLATEAGSAVAKARSWLAGGEEYPAASSSTRGGYALSPPRLPPRPPASVYALPVRIEPAVAQARRNGSQTGSSNEEPSPLEQEAAAITFNYAMSRHILGYTGCHSDDHVRLAHFETALAIYELANHAASQLGYVGMTHMVKALLGNMAEIHCNVFGRKDAAEELLEEMRCVHVMQGEGSDGSSEEESSLEFLPMLGPKASPSA